MYCTVCRCWGKIDREETIGRSRVADKKSVDGERGWREIEYSEVGGREGGGEGVKSRGVYNAN